MIVRGEIYSANLDPVVGSEQGGSRPVVVVQNDVGNRFSPTVIVLAVTSQLRKARLPTHVQVNAGAQGLARDSVVLAEQIRTIDKRRLKERIGRLPQEEMERIDQALRVSMGLCKTKGPLKRGGRSAGFYIRHLPTGAQTMRMLRSFRRIRNTKSRCLKNCFSHGSRGRLCRKRYKNGGICDSRNRAGILEGI